MFRLSIVPKWETSVSLCPKKITAVQLWCFTIMAFNRFILMALKHMLIVLLSWNFFCKVLKSFCKALLDDVWISLLISCKVYVRNDTYILRRRCYVIDDKLLEEIMLNIQLYKLASI